MDPYNYRFNILPETAIKCEQVLVLIRSGEYALTRACQKIGITPFTMKRYLFKNKINVKVLRRKGSQSFKKLEFK